MDIYIVRHGDAAGFQGYVSDAERPLTDAGVQRMQLAGHGLERLGVKPEFILSSPLVRARQTAELIAVALGMEEEVQTRAELSPGCEIIELERVLETLPDVKSVMLVGHQPDCGLMIDLLCGLAGTPMKPGTVVLIHLREGVAPGSGTLVWHKEADDLIALTTD